MSPGSNTESYPAFAHIGLRENPGKNLNQFLFNIRTPASLTSKKKKNVLWVSEILISLRSENDSLAYVSKIRPRSLLKSACVEARNDQTENFSIFFLTRGDNAGEMSPGFSTESYPAFARIGLRENPGKKPQPGNSLRPGFEPGPPGFAARRADRYSTDTALNEMFKPEVTKGGVVITSCNHRHSNGYEEFRSRTEGDNAGEMSLGSSTESYPALARVGLRENPGKNLNQVTCPDRDSNPVSQPDALTVTPQVWTEYDDVLCVDFSCAAQQLNASQSTHRFSFVNHTIKTVNMPKVRHSVNLKSKLTSYISEFKEDGLSTDNKILFCNLCQCAVSSTQKFLVQQHITTSKHQANKQLNSKQRQLFLTQPTTSNVRSEFNIDLCRSLISADIPLYKLKNKVFREFLEKYTQHTIPDESTLRKTYAPSIYDETIQKIRDEIKDSSIWVSIDETPDKEGRLVGNVVIGLLSEQYSERILLHCDVLEKCNNKTIVKLFNEAMGILSGQRQFPKVDLLISSVKKVFLKAPSRVNVLKEMYPEIPLPPKPILTRWGTWLEAVEYYAEHIDSINNVLLALDSEDAVSIDTAKTVTCDISVKNDLAHIQHTFSCIIKTLKSLQNRHLSLSESFEIINSTVEQLNRGRGKVADAVRAKVDTVLSKNPGYEELQKVVAVMSGESTVKINLDLSPADIVKLNYVPVTSCDVERSFSQYKSILRDNRRRFTFQHLKEMFVTYCYGNRQ
ncbi:hypothetical protein ANN_02422 [Periplaneta americana]|uniref:DUF659 domain-containing protein n=1 Tax=Periplaneta americana TaxID=6978 RepID=A0ABQ8TW77_PERAM|nr:hypothetical protein ANN_02422 [Periplaneta americana]